MLYKLDYRQQIYSIIGIPA